MAPTKIFWLFHTDTSGFYEGALDPPMLGPSPVHDWIAAHSHLTEAFTFRYYEVLMGLAVVGSVCLLWRRQPWVVPILALPVLLIFFHLFFHAKDRFHIPIDPFVAVLAAVALVELGVWITRRVRYWSVRSNLSTTLSDQPSEELPDPCPILSRPRPSLDCWSPAVAASSDDTCSRSCSVPATTKLLPPLTPTTT